jgi:hypothetical protein
MYVHVLGSNHRIDAIVSVRDILTCGISHSTLLLLQWATSAYLALMRMGPLLQAPMGPNLSESVFIAALLFALCMAYSLRYRILTRGPCPR